MKLRKDLRLNIPDLTKVNIHLALHYCFPWQPLPAVLCVVEVLPSVHLSWESQSKLPALKILQPLLFHFLIHLYCFSFSTFLTLNFPSSSTTNPLFSLLAL